MLVPKTEAHRDRTDALMEESHIIKEEQGSIVAVLA